MGLQSAGALLQVVCDVGLQECHAKLLLIHHPNEAAPRTPRDLPLETPIRRGTEEMSEQRNTRMNEKHSSHALDTFVHVSTSPISL